MHIANHTITAAIQGQLQMEIYALRRDAACHEARIRDRETLKIQRLRELHLVKKELETHKTCQNR